MEDLIKSFKAQLYDRVTSPLFSSLLLAWVTWNHRLFFALLSSSDIAKRFELIDEVLYPTWKEVLGRGAVFPLLSALFLIYVFPIPARWAYEYTKSEQKRLKGIQQRIDDESPITQDEARELRFAIRKADGEFERALDERHKIIEKLRTEITNLRESTSLPSASPPASVDEVDEPTSSPAAELDERQVKLLYKLSDASSAGLRREDLTKAENSRDQLLFDYAYDELMRLNMIHPGGVSGRISLTPSGRAALVAYDMAYQEHAKRVGRP